jgi:hypothetical protein
MSVCAILSSLFNMTAAGFFYCAFLHVKKNAKHRNCLIEKSWKNVCTCKCTHACLMCAFTNTKGTGAPVIFRH